MRRFPIGPLLRHVEELYQPTVARESAVRLAEARVVLADYELLRADFPYLSTSTPTEIDAWLLEHAAVISGRQTVANNVNTTIPITDQRVPVARPPRYGRAIVVPIAEGGLLDIKGAGVADDAVPQRFVHSTGLMFLGEALSDLAYQRAIDRMLRHAESAFWSVPTYAVLSVGFGIHSDPGILSAGLQVRRAHRRPLMGGDLPSGGTTGQRVKFEIEMILRHFGVTSCNSVTTIERTIADDGERQYSYGGQPMTGHSPEQRQQIDALLGTDHDRFEGVNIQLVREHSMQPASAQIVDFGHYEVRRRFEHPVVSLVNDRLARWGGALRPNHPRFVQPDPELVLPLDEWENQPDLRLPGVPGTSRQARVDEECFALADSFAKDRIERTEVAERFDAILERATRAWWKPEASS